MLDQRFVKGTGAIVLVINLAVVGLSLSDMYLMGSGAIRVKLPTGRNFMHDLLEYRYFGRLSGNTRGRSARMPAESPK
jgi:hypothetical protein